MDAYYCYNEDYFTDPDDFETGSCLVYAHGECAIALDGNIGDFFFAGEVSEATCTVCENKDPGLLAMLGT